MIDVIYVLCKNLIYVVKGSQCVYVNVKYLVGFGETNSGSGSVKQLHMVCYAQEKIVGFSLSYARVSNSAHLNKSQVCGPLFLPVVLPTVEKTLQASNNDTDGFTETFSGTPVCYKH